MTATDTADGSFVLDPVGPFSLTASSRFVEGFPAGQGGSSGARLDLAFPLDGTWGIVGVRLAEQHGRVVGTVVHNPAGAQLAAIRRDVERILSLDVDARGFAEVGARDEVAGRLQRRFPGLRPVQFHTPYEAAAWAVIGHRIRMTQAAAIRRRIALAHGEAVPFGASTLPAFPSPQRLRVLPPTPGLTERKVDQLRAIGAAALEGDLDAARLRSMSRTDALARLQQLPGIGPFSAELVLLRGAGDPDAFPSHEPRLHRAMRAVYGLPKSADVAALEAIADRWRPYRTWVALLLRTWLEQETGEIATGRRAAQVPAIAERSPTLVG